MPTVTQIKAEPTKAFFVKMLTRDIELADAILDLLDNCVDGIVRERKRRKQATNGKPYDGFWAKITASPDRFEIWDNCGGIPRKVAIESAFMHGRPDPTRDADIETVGVYGIGMKRAMYKLGRHAVVVSQPDTGPFKVEISPQWLDDEPADSKRRKDGQSPWELDLVPISTGLKENGTKITVTQLHPEISRSFDSAKSSFLADLEKEVARHYALIIGKGFTVAINGATLDPVSLTILAPQRIGDSRKPSVEPYVLTGPFDGVQVDLAVGFYRPLATQDELDDDDFVLSSRENAGWTIVCNDRVVLYNDKTFKTGWGTKGMTPAYHNQFISIRGIASFRSKESMDLPLNTTKRGLATDSLLYQSALDYMRTGLKLFTSFTNRWKRQEEETTRMFRSLSQRSLKQIIQAASSADLTTVRNHPSAKYYAPDLPKPKPQEKERRICFPAEVAEIETVASYYFDDPDRDRSEVGRRCFDESLRRARRGKF